MNYMMLVQMKCTVKSIILVSTQFLGFPT